jgi:hypothetical protein
MHLHSTLDGRAGGFRLRGAVWAANPLSFRGFLYLIPVHGAGDGRYRVIEGEAESLWRLLEALGERVIPIVGAPVQRLDARAVVASGAVRRTRRGGETGRDASGPAPAR